MINFQRKERKKSLFYNHRIFFYLIHHDHHQIILKYEIHIFECWNHNQYQYY